MVDGPRNLTLSLENHAVKGIRDFVVNMLIVNMLTISLFLKTLEYRLLVKLKVTALPRVLALM